MATNASLEIFRFPLYWRRFKVSHSCILASVSPLAVYFPYAYKRYPRGWSGVRTEGTGFKAAEGR